MPRLEPTKHFKCRTRIAPANRNALPQAVRWLMPVGELDVRASLLRDSLGRLFSCGFLLPVSHAAHYRTE